MSLRGRTVGATALVAEAQFLVVLSGGMPVALPSDFVRGILQPEDAQYGQTIVWLGATYSVTDLADRFGWPRADWTGDTRAILCGYADCVLAFRVDQVMGITDVDRRQIMPLPTHFSGPERTWINGIFLFRESVALVSDPVWLLGQRQETAKPLPVIEPQEPARKVAQEPVPSRTRQETETVEAEEVNLADQLEVEPIEDVNDAENAPWADI